MKLLISIILLMTNLVFAQSNLEKDFSRGVAAFERGDPIKAERFFDKVLKKNETYADAYLWKSKCLLHFEEYSAAYQQLEIAIHLVPTSAHYYIEKGHLKITIGQSAIQKAELCGDCGKYILPNNDGKVKSIDYYRSAIKDYKKATELDKLSGAAYYYWAVAEKMIGNPKKACLYYQKSLELAYPISKKEAAQLCK